MTFEEFRHFQETESLIRRGESQSLSTIAPLTVEGLRDMIEAGNSASSITSAMRDREQDKSLVSGGEKGGFLGKLFRDTVAASTSHSSGKSLECFSNSPAPSQKKSREAVKEEGKEVE